MLRGTSRFGRVFEFPTRNRAPGLVTIAGNLRDRWQVESLSDPVALPGWNLFPRGEQGKWLADPLDVPPATPRVQQMELSWYGVEKQGKPGQRCLVEPVLEPTSSPGSRGVVRVDAPGD